MRSLKLLDLLFHNFPGNLYKSIAGFILFWWGWGGDGNSPRLEYWPQLNPKIVLWKNLKIVNKLWNCKFHSWILPWKGRKCCFVDKIWKVSLVHFIRARQQKILLCNFLSVGSAWLCLLDGKQLIESSSALNYKCTFGVLNHWILFLEFVCKLLNFDILSSNDLIRACHIPSLCMS